MRVLAKNKADEKTHIRNWQETYAMARPYISKGTVGIDVGCREGGFSAQMEDDFSHIHAFDFRDRWLNNFRRNVKDFSKFTFTACGISDKNGTEYTRSMKAGRIKGTGNIAVPIRTLDSFEIDNVGFIKYDIEGYELKAVRGSEQTIKKFYPVIVVEQNRGNIDTVHLLEQWGYACKGVDEMFKQDYLMVKE